jgi:hypothetical protein
MRTGHGPHAFPGNIIPATRLSPQALAMYGLFPAAEHEFVRHQLTPTTTCQRRVAITGNLWNTRWDYY